MTLPVLTSPVVAWAPLLVLTAIFLLGLVVFALKSAFRGLTRTDNVDRLGGSIVGSRFLLEYTFWMFSPVARAAIRLGIDPDALSWASLVLQLLAGWLLAVGSFAAGGWVLVFGAFCDALDGWVARARGVASDAGEVLDAALDRWAETAVFLGLAWYYRELWWGFLLAAAACAGAVMVSYARAKGQAFGVDAKLGLMQRHERAGWVATATVFSGLWELWRPSLGFARHPPTLVALGVIAVLANVTAWRRVAFVRAELRRRDSARGT
jgi:phosphatidylglycerophosphate synthase